jgi:hypothetical protein
MAMSESVADPQGEKLDDKLVDGLIAMIRNGRVSDAMAVIESHADPCAMAAALGAAVKALYRQHDVTRMIVAGQIGLAYCLRQAGVAADEDTARQLKQIGRAIAFNTAANCWPGWGDAGIVIADAHVAVGLELAIASRALVQDLGLAPRAQGSAHWLVGALELAAGRFEAAYAAFAQAEQAVLAADAASSDALAASALMARGYMALARKADPRSRTEGADRLGETVARLRAAGSKEARFFADQLATADRILLGA